MTTLQSRIVYGVEVSQEGGDMDYQISEGLASIAEKHKLEAVWAGKSGEAPLAVTIGVILESYSEEGPKNNINLKELLEKEEKAKANFPEEQVLDAIHDFLHVELKMLFTCSVLDANTIIIHFED